MRILFVGSTLLGLKTLESVLAEGEVEIVGCLTAPPEFEISYSETPVRNVLHADFAPVCERHGIPLRESATGMRDEKLLDWAAHLKPDALLVLGWYHMVPPSWLKLAPGYAIHASLLPDLAGGAPLVWAILLGREETGVTFFRLEAGVDTGDVLGQASFPVLRTDTIADLVNRAEHATRGLVMSQLSLLKEGMATCVPQDQTRRIVMPQRSPRDGEINWSWPAEDVYRLIRASTRPYPGAFTVWRGRRVTLWSGHPVDYVSRETCQECGSVPLSLHEEGPGAFRVVGEDLLVQCGIGLLHVRDWEVNGVGRPAGLMESPFPAKPHDGESP